MFKCLYLISLKHGFLQTYSSRWIFWYEQFYVFSITPKTSTVPLDDVFVSHGLVGRIFIILWFTLIAWFWWHRGFCTLRESYRRSISPRRSLSSWSWKVRAESGDLWRTSPSYPLRCFLYKILDGSCVNFRAVVAGSVVIPRRIFMSDIDTPTFTRECTESPVVYHNNKYSNRFPLRYS